MAQALCAYFAFVTANPPSLRLYSTTDLMTNKEVKQGEGEDLLSLASDEVICVKVSATFLQ